MTSPVHISISEAGPTGPESSRAPIPYVIVGGMPISEGLAAQIADLVARVEALEGGG